MKYSKMLRAAIMLYTCACALLVQAVEISATNSVAGEWSSNISMARAQAKLKNKFFIINFGRTEGCQYCAQAESAIYSRPEFIGWAKTNDIHLVYADYNRGDGDPLIAEVRTLYPSATLFPTAILVNEQDGKTTLGMIVVTDGTIYYNQVLSPFTTEGFVKTIGVMLNRRDETALKTMPIGMSDKVQTQRLYNDYGVNTLEARKVYSTGNTWRQYSETNDWYSITNIVASKGHKYQVRAIDVVDAADAGRVYFYTNKVTAMKGTNSAFASKTLLSLAAEGFSYSAVKSEPHYMQFTRTPTNKVAGLESAYLEYAFQYSFTNVPVVSLESKAVQVSDTGTNLTLQVTRSHITDVATTVNWRTQDGSAQAGVDYFSASGSVPFAPGELTNTISVQVLDDKGAWKGGDRTFSVLLLADDSVDSDITNTVVTIKESHPSMDARDGADGLKDAFSTNATRLAMSPTQQSLPGSLNAQDQADWFVFTNIVPNARYRIGLTNLVEYHEATNFKVTLYMGTNVWKTFSKGNLNNTFVEFTPDTTNTLYLALTRDPGVTVGFAYTLLYQAWPKATVGFTQASWTCDETNSLLRLSVQRAVNLNDPLTVLCDTLAGTATAGLDYETVHTNLMFATGAADATVLIPIVDSKGARAYSRDFTVKLTVPADITPVITNAIVEIKPVDRSQDANDKGNGDDVYTNATALAFAPTNLVTGVHYLSVDDTSDWFAFTNFVPNTHYRLQLTDFATVSSNPQVSIFSTNGVNHGITYTNMPLSHLTNAFYLASGADTNTLVVHVWRDTNTEARVRYVLQYRELKACAVGFDPSSIATNVNAASVTLHVKRQGRLTDSVQAHYVSGDAIAAIGQALAGDLTFGANQETNAIVVSLANAPWTDLGSRSFTLALTSSSEKVTVTNSASATVTLTDVSADRSDPGDGTWEGATHLQMTADSLATGEHYLSGGDSSDWYCFTNVLSNTISRIWITDYKASHSASNLFANFYVGNTNTIYTNAVVLATLTNAFLYTSTTTSNLYVQITRDPNPLANVRYTLHYTQGALSKIVLSTNEVSVAEGGTTNLMVWLSAPPTSVTTVNVARVSSNNSDIYVSAGSNLVFDASNWTNAQSVVLTAREDNTNNVSGAAAFTLSRGGEVATFTARERDNDSTLTLAVVYDDVERDPPTMTYYTTGTTISLTAPAVAGYHFDRWSGAVSGTANPSSLLLLSNVGVTNHYAINTYALNYTAGLNGSITGTLSQTVTYGGSGTEVRAVPSAHYNFVRWSDGKVDNPRTDTNVMAVVAVTAEFVKISYSLTYSAGTGGSIGGVSNQAVPYNENGSAVTALPNAGSRFVRWSDNLLTVSRTDLAVSNASYAAEFEVKPNQPPRITAMSPLASSVTLVEGAAFSFSLTADDNNDTDPEVKGMRSITWATNDFVVLTTTNRAPNAISSIYTFRTTTNTVQGVDATNFIVKATAYDKLSSSTEVQWTVTVQNSKATQFITFPVLPVVALAATNFPTGARASSDLPVSYSNSNDTVAQVDTNGVITLLNAGTTIITARQVGSPDFKPATSVARTLTVKARLTTVVAAGNGTVTGAGLYMPGTKVPLTATPALNNTFLRWEDGSQTPARSLVMPNSNVTVSAWFGLTASVQLPQIVNPGEQRAMVGVFFTLPIDVTSDSLPTVTVSGLPAGLKYEASIKLVTGVPTTAGTNKTATITAKNVKGSVVQTFKLAVDPLPAWAQGNFNGWFLAGTSGHGPVSADVSSQGKITGKLWCLGTNFTFSAPSYAGRDADGSFWFATNAIFGLKKSMPLTFAVSPPSDTIVVQTNLSIVDGWVTVATNTTADATLYRNVWKDAGMAAVATNYTGYYTATLPGTNDYGSGYLTFTVTNGTVKTVGKLADGTPVSLSGALILDENNRVFTVLCTTPLAYKGGCLFGFAEFVKPDDGSPVFVRLLEGKPPFLWESNNPQATPVYGEGFSRDLGLAGGWYDTVGNLYAYYRDRTLTVVTDGAPIPELIVGTNRYDSVCWDPNGITLSVVTNRSGILTDLAAPRAGVPVIVSGVLKDDTTQTAKRGGVVQAQAGTVYDYSAINAVGLTNVLTRSTGLFKGTFKAWFDYPATHTYRSISYEGVLTPEREDMGDGIEGRGFFLWADKTVPPMSPYNFNWSYDFKIQSAPANP